jgi:hypothetical protein
MTVGGWADPVFCFDRPCECHLYAAPLRRFGREFVRRWCRELDYQFDTGDLQPPQIVALLRWEHA